jgi:hypothetical protein
MNFITDKPQFCGGRWIRSELLTIKDPIEEMKDAFAAISWEANDLSMKATATRKNDHRFHHARALTEIVNLADRIRALAKQAGVILEEGE